MAQALAVTATSDLFAQVLETPAVQSLVRRLESGGVLSCPGVAPAAQPFLAALLHNRFPGRPVVVVTEGLKLQESFQQDVSTWLQFQSKFQSPKFKATLQTSAPNPPPHFWPAWEILPHEDRLPHADVISDRLETLVALTRFLGRNQPKVDHAARSAQHTPIVITSVISLLQRTFPADLLQNRTRSLSRGDRTEPLDLVDWLEAQGYEPEAQVTQKGELALRGGILDIYPVTSPWPVRLEFFGDELESLRYFDPLTQISREEISSVTIPPGGELGILKKEEGRKERGAGSGEKDEEREDTGRGRSLGTLLDYLPRGTIFLLCEPEQLAGRADEYRGQIPEGDPFFIAWEDLQNEGVAKGMTMLAVEGGEVFPLPEAEGEGKEVPSPHFQSLDAYRPLLERAPEAPVAEAQRREFFAQLHRWLRQGFAVHVFCNNDGEQQRFGEIWQEFGLGGPDFMAEVSESQQALGLSNQDSGPRTHLGSLARGFVSDQARIVVVTDAEIFGRYKVQRPRRLRSPHAQATRSALDIDFTDLEESDYVVHLQHGIGRYLGLQVLPIGVGTKATESAGPANAGQECLVIE